MGADIFLLSEKEKKYFIRLGKAIQKAFESEGIDYQQGHVEASTEQLRRVRDRMRVNKAPVPGSAVKKWMNISGRKFFSLLRLPVEHRPVMGKREDEPLEPNEFFLDNNGKKLRCVATEEWFIVKSDTGYRISIEGNTLQPVQGIDQRSKANAMLKDGFDDGDAETVSAIREALELSEYAYIPLWLFNRINFNIAICRNIAQINLSADPSTTTSEGEGGTQIIEAQSLWDVPSTPSSQLILDIMKAGKEGLHDLPGRKKQTSHGIKMTVSSEKKNDRSSRKVRYESGENILTIEIEDINILAGSNKAGRKLWLFLLIQINRQALHKGKLTRDFITFRLQDLIDIGAYKTIQSARRGFKDGIMELKSFFLNWDSIPKTGEDAPRKSVIGFQPIRYGETENSQCIVYLEDKADWWLLTQYFTKLPPYCFSLSSNAFDLIVYIFFIARQRTKIIEKQKYFTISLRAVHNCLNLPSEDGNRRPAQLIKRPIEQAVKEIEDAQKKHYGNTNFSLQIIANDDAPITEYLDRGYLQIGLEGEFADTFIEISENRAKKVDAAKRRKARIEEKAAAINEAKKDNGEGGTE